MTQQPTTTGSPDHETFDPALCELRCGASKLLHGQQLLLSPLLQRARGALDGLTLLDPARRELALAVQSLEHAEQVTRRVSCAPGQRPRFEPCDFSAMVRAAAGWLSGTQFDGPPILQRVAPGVPRVTGDRVLLQHVAFELLADMAKDCRHAPEARIVVEIGATHTGDGPPQLEVLFGHRGGPQRPQAELARTPEGLTRDIVAMHGGRLAIEVDGTVRFRLPALPTGPQPKVRTRAIGLDDNSAAMRFVTNALIETALDVTTVTVAPSASRIAATLTSRPTIYFAVADHDDAPGLRWLTEVASCKPALACILVVPDGMDTQTSWGSRHPTLSVLPISATREGVAALLRDL
ncbi:MAG: sensor histidine kinase [Planctomycetes bacterium]|nr:sensor histidine kinase [Planctomycetota bacterium]